jgi:TPR repeat protein
MHLSRTSGGRWAPLAVSPANIDATSNIGRTVQSHATDQRFAKRRVSNHYGKGNYSSGAPSTTAAVSPLLSLSIPTVNDLTDSTIVQYNPCLGSAIIKLERSSFALINLPQNCEDPLWNDIRAECELSLSELGALKNFVAKRNSPPSVISENSLAHAAAEDSKSQERVAHAVQDRNAAPHGPGPELMFSPPCLTIAPTLSGNGSEVAGDNHAYLNLGYVGGYEGNVNQDQSWHPPSPQDLVKQYRQAASEGDAEAQYKLAECYENGDGVSKALAEAVKWYRRSAEKGLAAAQCSLGRCYQNGDGVSKDLDEALKWYQRAADQGDSEAQYSTAFCCYAQQDPDGAMKWLLQAANQGHAAAQFRLGAYYHKGLGKNDNFEKAIHWYEAAAREYYKSEEPSAVNHGRDARKWRAKAQQQLGSCYLKGSGVERDPTVAVKYFKMASENGDPSSQYVLGDCYFNGIGVVKDDFMASQCFYWAADSGHANAQYCLGVCHQYGDGVPFDLACAAEWYRLASDQGHALAQFNLGICYFSGIGLAKDQHKAVSLFRAAAEQNIPTAQYKLSVCLLNGLGVAKDIKQAGEYFRLASSALFDFN